MPPEALLLFNSYPFLFGFLPIALIGYQIAAHFHRRAVVVWLLLASLAFYAYWRPVYLVVLGCSILFNFGMAVLIGRQIRTRIPTGYLLAFAITVNLSALCFYKYLFPVLNWFGRHQIPAHHWEGVSLPLGISFFTFTQIAYLVDLQQGGFKQHAFADYALFATFFPHLIAGPILHHAEMMPQFQAERDYRLRADDLAVGFSWFVMGLVKKVLLADHFGPQADQAFLSPHSLSFTAAWAGSLSYALQLYFDFSGYSDMALGLARMFSIDFPLNFASPYKATSILDYWERWHMTLTRYINLYVYTPVAVQITRWRSARGLKSSRKATATPGGFASLIIAPTFFALFLAGVWHGAGLQFILFGLLHAFYLIVNHAWRLFRRAAPATPAFNARLGAVASCLLTFLCVLLAQVFFRANGVTDACHYLAGLAGLHRSSEISSAAFAYHPGAATALSILAGLIVVWCFPNTQQILAKFKPALGVASSDHKPALVQYLWRPTPVWGLGLGVLLLVAVIKMQDPSSFLYFQF